MVSRVPGSSLGSGALLKDTSAVDVEGGEGSVDSLTPAGNGDRTADLFGFAAAI